VSAESFVQPTARILRPFLKYRNIATLEGLDRRHFPEKVTVKTEITSIMETLVYLPIIRKIEKFSVRLAFLQAGSIHSYLLYVCGTLIVLLVLARI
jgi:hydrogenase-4 component B